ncbi:uncharacterized protein LOC108914597 [Anoplophora glabripennis]|uniref:uncharacterized protein LOC108914597 n=1 Tax=Anoplophora glabripennis TaxID=217634 RepID=UPI00087373F4|nr:uncharacterized protein LOC108914597 [Anoplophora glabripennis]
MKCEECKQIKVRNKDIFNCDGCNKEICKDCGGLTASEIKVLQLASRIMKYYCQKCLTGRSLELCNKLVLSMETIIEDKTMIINMLQEEIEELKKKLATDQTGSGYSQAVKKHIEEVILVKPKDITQTSEVTKKSIEEKINPSELGIGVSRIKYIRDGGVAIKCNENSKERVVNVCETIKTTLGQSYDVNIPERRNPRIIVFNVYPRELDDEDNLLDKIILQNSINTEPNKRELKIVHKIKNHQGTMNVILQMDVHTYQCIEKREKLHIGWKSCFFRVSVNVKQCYNCWKFGHIAKECKKETPTCQKCAGEHKATDCNESEVCCVNCRYAAEVLKVPKIDSKHKAYDKNCEAYKRVVEQLQEKVKYPEIYINKNKI